MSESVGKLTLADIARLAGVGVGTASRALNGSPSVATTSGHPCRTSRRSVCAACCPPWGLEPDAT